MRPFFGMHQLFVVFAVFMTTATFIRADEISKYDELVQAPGSATTVRSLAVCILALSNEPDNVTALLSKWWWANNPKLQVEDTIRELERSKLRQQLSTMQRIVQEQKLTKLDLVGFSQVGTIRHMDLYYAAESNIGPIVFRVSIAFRKDQEPLLHQFAIFEGFEQVRGELSRMTYSAQKSIASVTYPSPAKPDPAKDGSK